MLVYEHTQQHAYLLNENHTTTNFDVMHYDTKGLHNQAVRTKIYNTELLIYRKSSI